jgi:hypothetical protein
MQQHHASLLDTENNSRNPARGKLLRTSHNSFPSEPTNGFPIGHENSTSLTSSPIVFRSSLSRLFNHSRTGCERYQTVLGQLFS